MSSEPLLSEGNVLRESGMAARLDVLIQRDLDPARSLAVDHHLMRAFQRQADRPPVLRIYSLRGPQLALGHYHVSPPGPFGEIGVYRRISGGRALPGGGGFVGVSLHLPHRAAWFSENPFALAPHQVLNRYVRGIMEALRRLGVPAYYPGRDFVTANRCAIVGVSFTTDAHGALLVEATFALHSDFSMTVRHLDAVDSGGVVKCQVIPPAELASIDAVAGRRIEIEELAGHLADSYAGQSGREAKLRELSLVEEQAIDAIVERESGGWLAERSLGPTLDGYVSEWTQLGVFEIYFSLEQQRFLKDVMFCGDFFANVSGLTELERALRLCELDWRTIDETVNGVLRHPGNFLLGIGKTTAIADLLTKGLRS